MADISKCTGEGCSLKETCYRFTAPSGMLQSFFINPPIKDGECDYYWSKIATSSKESFESEQDESNN
jgi:hypothetical protein